MLNDPQFNPEYHFHDINELSSQQWTAYFKKHGNIQSSTTCKLSILGGRGVIKSYKKSTRVSVDYSINIEISKGNYTKDFDEIDIVDCDNIRLVTLRYPYEHYRNEYSSLNTSVTISVMQ